MSYRLMVILRGKKIEVSRKFFTASSPLPTGIQTEQDAKLFAKTLMPGERKLLFDSLRKITSDQYNMHKQVIQTVIHHDDMIKIWYVNFVPMFVYGVLDEAALIVGGDAINHFFSIYNGMSMLAAAAVANVICNMCLQIPSHRSIHWFGIRMPVLSADQMNTDEYKRITLAAKLTGLWLGLTLGLLPLFYIDDNLDVRAYTNLKDSTTVSKRDIMSNEYCDLSMVVASTT